jgi:hypothetical protein
MRSIPRDPDHPDIRWEEICVRDVETPDIGIRNTTVSECSGLSSRGVGSILSDAHQEIEDRLDLEEYVGETVAEVYCDVDRFEYAIEYHVDVPLKQRVWRLLYGPSLGADGTYDDEIELYRCTECGKLSTSLGWLHGHIEKHRPLWLFWKSGHPDFLCERTEVITVTEYDVERYLKPESDDPGGEDGGE